MKILSTLIGGYMLFIPLGAIAGKISTDPAAGAGFIPHKALYEVKLSAVKSGTQIVNIGGQMLYEWQSSCEGWTSSHRFNLSYEYADTPPMKLTSDFSTFESFDKKNFDFVSRRKRNGILFSELRGQVIPPSEPKKPREVLYSLPEGVYFDLPDKTLFPMAHTLEILEHLKKGSKFYSAIIFDGSTEDGPVEVNAFIGKPVNVIDDIEPSPDVDMTLLNTPARQVRLAFFPLNSASESAEYEMDLVFHENGVVSSMVVDYDDFSVVQKLIALEPLAENCSAEIQ